MNKNIMNKDIFSIHIVDLSHYMTKPIRGLDSCFSEFRAKEIKSVPIIRIFGCNSDGVKTCLHVHCVLPYFYIPYDSQNKEFEKFVYQLCKNLDKALNVSLGQSSSQTHHIFKVKLVKAFPFYGYHRKEHLFLKIYIYNSRLLKRAANLLQNGALNGKSFQAFDSHVPYKLQFLIDFNLFPMSFLHVPFDMVKEQILGRNVEKISTSKLEIEIRADHILNRKKLQNEMATGKNKKEVLKFLRQVDDENENIHDQINNLSNLVLSDSEDESLNVLTNVSQSAKPADKNSISIPQLDGAVDELYSPSKYAFTTIKNPILFNRRSPRTLKPAERSRFKPHQGISNFSPKPAKKNNLETSSDSEAASSSSNETYRHSVNRIKRKIKNSDSLSKRESPRKKSVSRTKFFNDDIVSLSSDLSENSLKPIRNNSKLNLGKTYVNITCNLKTPKRSKKFKNELKMLKCKVRLKKSYSKINASAAAGKTDRKNTKILKKLKPPKQNNQELKMLQCKVKLKKSNSGTNFIKFSATTNETEDQNQKTDRNNTNFVSKDLVTVGNTFLNDKSKQKIETDDSETDGSLAIEDLLSIQQIKLKMQNEEIAKNNRLNSTNTKSKSEIPQTNEKELFCSRLIKSPDQDQGNMAKRLIRIRLARRATYNESVNDVDIQQKKIKVTNKETAKNNEIKPKYIRWKSDDSQTNDKELFYLRKIIKTPDEDYMPKILIRTRLARRANSVISYNEFFNDSEIDYEASYQTQSLKIVSEQHSSNNNKNEISAKSPNSQNKESLKQFHVKIKKQINTPIKTKTFSTNSKTKLNIDKTTNKISSRGMQWHVIQSQRTNALNSLGLNNPKTTKQNKFLNKTNGTAEYKTDSIKKCKVQIKRLNI